MSSLRLQVTGVILALLGWLGTILSCALPMWRVTAFTGSKSSQGQIISEGLWKICNFLNTTQIQCPEYESLLPLPKDLQVARVLMVTCIIVAALGLLFSVVGGKRAKRVEEETAKAKVTTKAGVMFLMAGLLVLVPVCWTAYNITYSFLVSLEDSGESQKMGTSLYIGWAASGLLLLGGSLLCCTWVPHPTHQPYSAKYSAACTDVSHFI
uniref:Claudin n=1 Tax=Castor canadensis TaxID=51338 RepID=A0A8C0WTA5_CASCN